MESQFESSVNELANKYLMFQQAVRKAQSREHKSLKNASKKLFRVWRQKEVIE